MKRYLVIAAAAASIGAPAFAQMEVTCGDYTLMDNAQADGDDRGARVRDQPDGVRAALTAEAIHEKLAADCEGQVDVMVIEVIKG